MLANTLAPQIIANLAGPFTTLPGISNMANVFMCLRQPFPGNGIHGIFSQIFVQLRNCLFGKPCFS